MKILLQQRIYIYTIPNINVYIAYCTAGRRSVLVFVVLLCTLYTVPFVLPCGLMYWLFCLRMLRVITTNGNNWIMLTLVNVSV